MSQHKSKKEQFVQPPKKKNLPVLLGAALGLIALLFIGWTPQIGAAAGGAAARPARPG